MLDELQFSEPLGRALASWTIQFISCLKSFSQRRTSSNSMPSRSNSGLCFTNAFNIFAKKLGLCDQNSGLWSADNARGTNRADPKAPLRKTRCPVYELHPISHTS